MKNNYIEDVFDTFIIRNIRQKFKIKNQQLMDKVVDYLMVNISNIVSTRNIRIRKR